MLVIWIAVVFAWLVTLRWALVYRGVIANQPVRERSVGVLFGAIGAAAIVTAISFGRFDPALVVLAVSCFAVFVWTLTNDGASSPVVPSRELLRENAYLSFAISVCFTTLLFVVTLQRGSW